VAGCIPVLFSRASLAQYSWHLSDQDVINKYNSLEILTVSIFHIYQVKSVAIYIPMKSVNEEGLNFLDVLKAIPDKEISRRQRLIAEIAPRLQYSVVRA
jgi:hypothetical protein